MSIDSHIQLSKDRCWICGIKLFPGQVPLQPYLCYWCSPEKTYEFTVKDFISDLVKEAEENLRQKMLIKCEEIDVLSLVADIGALAAHHTYLKQFSDMLGLITVQVALEHRYTPQKLIKVVSGTNKAEKWKRVRQCLYFLLDTGLLERGEGRYIYERLRPSDLLLSLADSIEVIELKETLPPRLANCIAGYALLKGINYSIEWLQRGAQNEPIGIIRLYPRKAGGLMIPKLFTAPVMFLLSYLTRNDEFSEEDLRRWLSAREIRGKLLDRCVNWLARVVPGSVHKLVSAQFDGYLYHFRFNPIYMRIRERLRERKRRRSYI